MGRLWTDVDRANWDEFVTATGAFYIGQDGHPNAIARLVKDAVVAAYVRGAMHGQYQTGRLEVPTDMEMLRHARETAAEQPDKFPALARLEHGHDPELEDESRDDD